MLKGVHQVVLRGFGTLVLAGLAANLFAGEPVLVKKITKVRYGIEKQEPPVLVVHAWGEVPSGGWTGVDLVRVRYVTPPADGIQDYELKAVPPTGPAIQVISTVDDGDRWERFSTEAPWLKGIRVRGEGTGVKEVLFNQAPNDPDVWFRASGTSPEGDFQKALDAAIQEASAHANRNGADIQIDWELDRITGLYGGLGGERRLEASIFARARVSRK
jgi:hypothetical protein